MNIAVTERLAMERDELEAYLAQVFPQIFARANEYSLETVELGRVVVCLQAGEAHLRPGNTVSGPVLMTLADLAAYALILSHEGEQALAVTTNLNINFLRKAEAGTVYASCRFLKRGKRLMVVDCEIYGADRQKVVAHTTMTYSMPPR
ncbi:PaaI family thioesterase [Polycladidibacter stylochi]|uniref:PaaI family thioesterase n=1 Tax=Polycladidibacter stylochi TaxID=1807766 RepID=UPI000832120E|nr:PaaI family thioesterase [Pseudovibrio stylochi]